MFWLDPVASGRTGSLGLITAHNDTLDSVDKTVNKTRALRKLLGLSKTTPAGIGVDADMKLYTIAVTPSQVAKTSGQAGRPLRPGLADCVSSGHYAQIRISATLLPVECWGGFLKCPI